MASVDANGITIEYDIRGESTGEPLLLVMGLGAQLTDWPSDFVDLLVDEGFRVIRLDNRDAGLSTSFDWEPPTMAKMAAMSLTRRKPDTGYHLRDMAVDAAALLDALDIGSAHVAGASMGGMIAQTMAIQHPARVRSLTSIMSTTGDRKAGRPEPRLLAKAARLPPPSRETAVDRAVEMFKLVGGGEFDESEFRARAASNVERSYRPEGTARQLTAIMAAPDRTAALARVSAPTLVVHGLVDPLVRPSGGVATAEAVPGSRLVMYPGMGHDLPRSRWPELVAAISRNAQRAG
ncbi:MAG: alpha/beta hydrolase [Ilumatobacter sp.]|nr:MAG: alpha/beta hydrolase [Ilumatobacter sp.]